MSLVADIATWARSHQERTRDVDLARLLVFVAALIQLLVAVRLFAFPGEPAGDDMSIHLAEIAGIARSLGSGEADLWNPSANAGFASGYYYQWLPQVVTAVLSLLFGWAIGLVAIFKLTVLATLALLPATVYRGLRVIGVAPIAAATGGLGASTVYAYSGWGAGIDSMFSTGLYTQAWALLFYPLAVGYAVRYLLDGEHLGRAVAYTLLCGFCHPFIAIAIAPAAICLPWYRVALRDAIVRAATLFAVALVASAPLWLPIIVHYDAFGAFPERVAGEDGMPLVLFLKEMARGNFMDVGRWPVTTYLALVGIAVAFTRRGRVLIPIYAAGFLFAGLIVAGPVIGKMKDDLLPAIRFLAPMQLCFGAAAGASFALGAPLVSRALGDALARWKAPRWPAALMTATASIVLVGILAGGVMARSTARVRTIEHWPQLYRAELAQVSEFLGEAPWGRVLAASEVGSGSHWWMYLHYVEADRPAVRAYGGASLQSSLNFAYLKELDIFEDHRLYAIRYFIASIEKAESDRYRARFDALPASVVFETEHYRVYRFHDAPMFDAVTPGAVIEGDRAARKEATLEWFRGLRREVAVYERIGPSASPENVSILEERHSRRSHSATLTVAGDRPALLRLAVTFHPGWQATIDGRPARTHRVGPAFVALEVPPGDHRVTIAFSRPWWTWALYALLVAVGLGWWTRQRKRRLAGASGAIVTLLLVLLWPAPAGAQPSALMVPTDAAFGSSGAAVVATTAGALVRAPREDRFRYVCPAVTTGGVGAFTPRTAVSNAGTIYITSYRGLRRGTSACDLESVPLYSPHDMGPFTSRWFSDVEATRARVWASTADGTHRNDVFVGAHGDGPLRSAHLESDRTWYLSVRESPEPASRIYVSGYRVAREADEVEEVAASLQVSVDGGETFAPIAADGLVLGRSRRARFVHAGAGGLVFVVAEAALEPGRDVLYRSVDGGTTFVRALEARGSIAGVARSRGGVWVATTGPCSDGDPIEPGCLVRLAGGNAPATEDDIGAAAQRHGAPRLSCLTTDPAGVLVGCRADAATSGVALISIAARSNDRARLDISPLLRVADVAPPCGSAARTCAAAWSRACRVLGADCELGRRAPPVAENAPPRAAPAGVDQRSRSLLFWVALALLAALPWLLVRRRRR